MGVRSSLALLSLVVLLNSLISGSVTHAVSNGEWGELHPFSIREKKRNKTRLGDSELLSDTYWLLGVKMDPGRQEMLL